MKIWIVVVACCAALAGSGCSRFRREVPRTEGAPSQTSPESAR